MVSNMRKRRRYRGGGIAALPPRNPTRLQRGGSTKPHWSQARGGRGRSEELSSYHESNPFALEGGRLASRRHAQQATRPDRRERELAKQALRQLIERASGGIIGLQEGGGWNTQGVASGGMSPIEGYGTPGQMQVRQETLNPNVAQEYGQVKDAIMEAGAQPLQQFGPGVAGMTDMETAAQAAIGAYGMGPGPQGTLQAQSTYDQAAGGIGGMIPQQQALATQYRTMAPQALTAAQTAGTGMGQLAARAELQ